MLELELAKEKLKNEFIKASNEVDRCREIVYSLYMEKKDISEAFEEFKNAEDNFLIIYKFFKDFV
jgi:hypothetical protein